MYPLFQGFLLKMNFPTIIKEIPYDLFMSELLIHVTPHINDLRTFRDDPNRTKEDAIEKTKIVLSAYPDIDNTMVNKLYQDLTLDTMLKIARWTIFFYEHAVLQIKV